MMIQLCPYQESNLDQRFRRPLLCPLAIGAGIMKKCSSCHQTKPESEFYTKGKVEGKFTLQRVLQRLLPEQVDRAKERALSIWAVNAALRLR